MTGRGHEMETVCCHVCGADALRPVPGYGEMLRITSDVRIWPVGGRLATCMACGAVQKPGTAAWRAECHAIYASYVVYRQGTGSEQAVFASSGAGEARSRWLLRRCIEELHLPATGRHLDFGCGDGSLLRNAAAFLPGWRRVGAELSESRREEIEAIPGVEAFHSGDPDQLPRQFDLVTTVHVIEHFENPTKILRTLSRTLAGGGRLVVQVPNLRSNPFDLLIADHATHFTPTQLARVIREAGLRLSLLSDTWIARELTAIGVTGAGTDDQVQEDPEEVHRLATSHVDWLRRLAETAKEAGRKGPYGIFGTSIAATWVAMNAPENLSFFVDEDLNRVGTHYLDRPVRHPADLPAGCTVLMAHTPDFSATMGARLAERAPEAIILQPPPL